MSGAMSRRKGALAERQVVNWLRENGFPHAERRPSGLPGLDVAELGPGLEIEIKNKARWEPAAWVDQLLAGMHETQADVGLVIAKNKGVTDVAKWHAITTVRISRLILAGTGQRPRDSFEVTKRAGREDQEDWYAMTSAGRAIGMLTRAGWGAL